MITGEVQAREACIRLKIMGKRKQRQETEVVIDTGYTASLTLPPARIGSLALRWKSFGRGILADGSECLFDVYEAKDLWDGKEKRVLVDEADTDPLVGMAIIEWVRFENSGSIWWKSHHQTPGKKIAWWSQRSSFFKAYFFWPSKR